MPAPSLDSGSLVSQRMLFFSDRCCSDHCIQPSMARQRAWFLVGSIALAYKILFAPLCSPQVHRQLELGHEEGGPGVSFQQVWRRESESPGCAHGGTRAKIKSGIATCAPAADACDLRCCDASMRRLRMPLWPWTARLAGPAA